MSGSLCHPVGFQSHSSWQVGTQLTSLSSEITARNYIFWPDQAVRLSGCHCAERPLDFLCETLIHHVGKVDNPASLPEVRPIKDFWSILRAKVYENNWEAKTLHEIEVRIKKCLKEVDQVTILKTFGCV